MVVACSCLLVEPSPILAGRDAHRSEESTASSPRLPNPQSFAMSATGRVVLSNAPASRLHPQVLDVAGRCHARLRPECPPRNVEGSYARDPGQPFDRQIGVEMLASPGLDLPKRLTVRTLGPHRRRELCLAARSLHVHHEATSDGEHSPRALGPPPPTRAPDPSPPSRPPRSRHCRRARRSGRDRP